MRVFFLCHLGNKADIVLLSMAYVERLSHRISHKLWSSLTGGVFSVSGKVNLSDHVLIRASMRQKAQSLSLQTCHDWHQIFVRHATGASTPVLRPLFKGFNSRTTANSVLQRPTRNEEAAAHEQQGFGARHVVVHS